MPRYFIQLSYSGTNYHGWQIQKNANSVQQQLNMALSTLLNQEIGVQGAGRTDTGVHAKKMFAHFDLSTTIEELDKTVFRINGILPHDIAVDQLFLVDDELHARFSALSRTYEYKLIQKKDTFLTNQAYFFYRQLDVLAMNKAASQLLDYLDFTSFSKLHTQTHTNNCKIASAKWTHINNGLLFTIRADRFLRNMVRAIVGTLLEVGLGKLSVKEFCEIVEAKNRSQAGFSVPAEGLYLVDVTYPKESGLS